MPKDPKARSALARRAPLARKTRAEVEGYVGHSLVRLRASLRLG
jgi:hypothetical protein